MHQGQVLVPLLEAHKRKNDMIVIQMQGPTKEQTTQLSPRCRGLRSVPCQLPSCPSRVYKFPQAQVSCLCEFPSHDLAPNPPHFRAHKIPPPSRQLDSQSSSQYLTADLCMNHLACTPPTLLKIFIPPESLIKYIESKVKTLIY